jgi:DNA-binding MarR family transcriptional regulator
MARQLIRTLTAIVITTLMLVALGRIVAPSTAVANLSRRRPVAGANGYRRDSERLLAFRVTLREFNRWSEDLAGSEGLTPAQHQLLAAIQGHPGPEPPTVGDLAGYLLLRSHSAVELVDRAEAAGLVERIPDRNDRRVSRVRLTDTGSLIAGRLTPAVLARLHELSATLARLADELGPLCLVIKL